MSSRAWQKPSSSCCCRLPTRHTAARTETERRSTAFKIKWRRPGRRNFGNCTRTLAALRRRRACDNRAGLYVARQTKQYSEYRPGAQRWKVTSATTSSSHRIIITTVSRPRLHCYTPVGAMLDTPTLSRRRQRSSPFRRTARLVLASMLLLSALLPFASSTPVSERSLEKRADKVNYTDPNTVGGGMLTIIPDLPDLGEPINVIVSGLSDESVLTIEGFLLWITSFNFGVSCLGQANGTTQSANLGTGNQTQGTGNGDNGVLRWNYGMPYIGTCKETFVGGNHFRWFQQSDTNAYFLAASVELDLSTSHMIAQNGYNAGRDELVGNATVSNGTQWEGNVYNTSVEWIEAGVLLNATSDGINHPSIALAGQPTQDGRVALLTVRQLRSASNGVVGTRAPSMLAVALVVLLATLTVA